MSKVIVVGGGEHAAVVADVLLASGRVVQGFVDDNQSPIACGTLQLPYLGNVDWLVDQPTDCCLIMGIGNNEIRLQIASRLTEAGFRFTTATHPSATISELADVQAGTVVMPRALINTNASVGRHCIINSAAVIEHDSCIGDGSHISVGTILAGRVHVGDETLVGAGAVVLPHLSIGSGVSVGAGAVVTKSIEDQCVAVGVPARVRSQPGTGEEAYR